MEYRRPHQKRSLPPLLFLGEISMRLRFVEKLKALIRPRPVGGSLRLKGHYKLRGLHADGSEKWTEEFNNIVVNVALDHVLDVALKNGTQIATWYIGIKGSGTPAAADSMASHATWSEIQLYTEANRPGWSGGSVSSQSVDNSGSPAQFTINQNGTAIYGAFLTSNNSKGGTTGTLFSAGDFASSKTLDNGEILEVTITYTAADDGV